MKVLSGKKATILPQGDFHSYLARFATVHIDIGTGSGRYVLKNAQKDPCGFYIGVDPVAAQMAENAVKAQKQRLYNVLFVPASVEGLPAELDGVADAITVCLPWGSLRDGIVKADRAVLGGLRFPGKPGAALTVWVGYDGRREAGELRRRGLPALSEEHFAGLSAEYRAAGICMQRITVIGNAELQKLESDWAKRLAYGPPRRMYRLDCRYV
ncbi:MAG: class I SAM-dependent methyltransferase [Oscillospiraceae bacterium]|jgi:16S rRNA (adenine(1408)-N(1))-methyltransferase|nr:class I SAM-dependent methyltransferase [Oscillospiraceae bacterium]